MDEEINNDPDFEQNSVDPFDSGESEIDDSGPEDDPPVQRIVDISSYKLSWNLSYPIKLIFHLKFNIFKTF